MKQREMTQEGNVSESIGFYARWTRDLEKIEKELAERGLMTEVSNG